jgi:hypothetical protein
MTRCRSEGNLLSGIHAGANSLLVDCVVLDGSLWVNAGNVMRGGVHRGSIDRPHNVRCDGVEVGR